MSSRRRPPLTPEERTQQRLSKVENGPPPWRGPMQTSDGTPQRSIRGAVNITSPALTNQGGGFTPTFVSTGVVDITFDTPFSGVPTVTCSADASTTPVIATVDTSQLSVNKVRLVRWTVAGSGSNGIIYFHVEGPA